MLNVVVLGVYNIFWKNCRYQKMHQILADKYMEITTVSESQYRDIFPVISKNIDILYTPEVVFGTSHTSVNIELSVISEQTEGICVLNKISGQLSP